MSVADIINKRMAMWKLGLLTPALLLAACDTITPLGDQALQRGDVSTATSYYSAAARRGEPGAWTKYGMVLDRQGRSADATEAFRNGALAGDPAASAALRARGLQAPAPALQSAPQLAGSSWTQRVEQLSAAGRCDDARSLAASDAPTNGAQAGVFAWISINCDKNADGAVINLNHAARYGNEWARKTLVQYGRPVPAADLVQVGAISAPQPTPQQVAQSPSSGEALATVLGAVLGGMAAARGAAAPAPVSPSAPSYVTCDARQTTMGANIGMNQSYSVSCR